MSSDTAELLPRDRPTVLSFAHLFGFLSVLLLGAVIGLSIMYVRLDNEDTTPPTVPCPTPPPEDDPNNDFPLNEYPPWDITQGFTRTIPINVNEGTWLSIDFFQNQIIFDLLGDIYSIPSEGGTATLIRGGPAFETQARFSPDGSFLLFTSDLSGCDNIWIMNMQSREAFQITNETFHWVSDAKFSPDGSYIVAVKWYTSTRSIGAGEIWKYTINYETRLPDTLGKKVVGRATLTSQVGVEEPVISVDGKYLYYSKNTADSTTWNYNKDPHEGIYSIYRMDLNTQQTITVAGGYGGAARPTPSANGTLLAFIKRIEFNTSLCVRNLNTNEEWVIYNNLSGDQQESYAPSGVYPNFVWLPNDDFIIWAKGQIVRINFSIRSATPIPFTVQNDITIAPTVRAQVDPSTGAQFSVKVIGSPVLYEQTIYFTALGTTYMRSLESGITAPLLPLDNTTFQFSPVVSPDGKYLAHATWNDKTFGDIVLINLSDLTQTKVTPNPGRYTHPIFSPDGTKIVYTKLGSDSVSGSFNSINPGIYMSSIITNGDQVSVENETLITRNGRYPEFTPDGKGLHITSGGYPQISLRQINIETGIQEMTLAQSKYATEITISPDGKYIAFVEFNEVYIAPFQQTSSGLIASSRPGIQTVNLKRLSVHGGASLQIDREYLRWTLGPNLYEFNLNDFENCDQFNCADKVSVIDLSFTVNTAVPQLTVVVIDNATIVTMNSNNEIIQNGRIIVEGDKITAIGTMDNIPIPPGNPSIIECFGGIVLPGFIDAHAHWDTYYDFKVVQNWQFVLNLAFGVTTMHNPSADTYSVFADAELVRAGKTLGPRLFSTGTILYGAGGTSHCDIASLSDALDNINRLKAYGAWSVKSYNQPCRRARQQILYAARQLNVSVVPEGGMAFYWNLNQIMDGHTTIEHSIPVAPLYEDVVTLLANSGTGSTPTFIVNFGGIWGERYWYQETNVWEIERLMKFGPQAMIRALSMRRIKSDPRDYHHFDTSSSLKAVYDAGGIVSAGAHGQMHGIGIHWEIRMFNQGGFSNEESLKAATINAARALGLDSYLGSLEVNKLADIIIYDPIMNPLLDINQAAQVKYVMKDGHVWDAETMNQILPSPIQNPGGPPINYNTDWIIGENKAEL